MLTKTGVPVGINGGAGRIGGNAFRAMIEHPTLGFNLCAINDVGLDPKNPAQNFVQAKAHDTTFGPWPCLMSEGTEVDALVMHTPQGPHEVKIVAEKDPAKIPWGALGVRGVAECTGVFRSRKTGAKAGYDSHLDGGASCVALSAPAADDVLTVVYGVHTTPLKGVSLLSGASCTSGSLAFPVRVLLDHRSDWKLEALDMVTVHAVTMGEQGLQDRPDHIKSGTRRMFAAPANIIPTTTGAAKAIPQVDGIGADMKGIDFTGDALRVPVLSGSITMLSAILSERPQLPTVLDAFRIAADGRFKGKFEVNENPCDDPLGLPLVSSHIVKRPESSILDAEFVRQSGSLYRFPLWYGNEWGYVLRLIEALHEQAG